MDATGLTDHRLPGSTGEHLLQCAYGTGERAERFYGDQVLDHLNHEMIAFVQRMELAFVATSDNRGEADCSLRAGPPGFLRVFDERCLAYPEYRGNGVMASLGNIAENPNAGLLLIDFTREVIGLHVNGRARIAADSELRAEFEDVPTDFEHGRAPECWVVINVVEAYIHCRKHIPHLRPVTGEERAWGTDDVRRKGGDHFGVRRDRREAAAGR
ncbi:pyridoxamine 5-phosphate oxidase [Amycolatopsis antarctica]|uniref:Pyridoxamine 5-phosphate oxidase n=1 Tax=Amycolatopsis antarctica TaxID=1854586 RepID=A0A263D188_9PSEU|nr:pyridoxamine 5'-phosphate oxidase family protein [Amycolatopsis antarctica]OZM71397.1 pyridoxamine 5-phosphate oxidase [Amycolatopsis antarctica]